MGIRRIQSYFKDKIKKHRDFFRLYTTGLNRREVERLLKKDTLEALTYWEDEAPDIIKARGVLDNLLREMS